MLSSGDITARRRQKTVASAKLPTGSDASLCTDVVSGKIWQSQDGCCDTPSCPPSTTSEFMIALVDALSPCTRGYTRLQICMLFQFSAPIPTNQSVTITNHTGQSVVYFLGNDTQIPIRFLAYTAGIAPGDTIILPSNITGNQTALYYTDSNVTLCTGS